MKNKYKLFLLFTLIHQLVCKTAHAQQNKTDSLLALLKTTKEDSTKVNAFNNLFLQYEFKDKEQAKEYLNKAKLLSQKIGYKKGLALTYTYLAYFSEDIANQQEALKNNTEALKIYTEMHDKKGMSKSYGNIGLDYFDQDDYPEALKNYLTSLSIDVAIANKPGIASTYNKVGLVYSAQGNYPEALKNYFTSLKTYENLGDKLGIAYSYNNIGIVYEKQDNYAKALENYMSALKMKEALADKKGIAGQLHNIGALYRNQGDFQNALDYLFKALKINEEIGNEKWKAYNLTAIGLVYSSEHKYPEALNNYMLALKIGEAMGDKVICATLSCNVGEVFTKQKKYRDAGEYLIKSNEMALAVGMKDLVKESYRALTILDSAKGDFKSAYANQKQFILYRDSLDNETTRKKTIQSQMTYDFEKKEAITEAEHKLELGNQRILAEGESHKQKMILWFVGSGLLLVCVFSGFVFRSLHVTRKQKLTIEEKSMLVEEKQKEILDSIHYAKRIQNALLKEEEHVSVHLPEHFVLFMPKDIVSGDFYWAMEKQEYLYMAAVDCTGHGVPGAMMSMLGISFLNEIVSAQQTYTPAEILNQLREKVVKELGSAGHTKDGMDISLCRFNLLTLQVDWAGANNPLWYFTGEEFKEIKADKQPVGYSDTYKPFTNHSINVKNCTYYLFTDGYADQFGGAKGKKYKYKQLQEQMLANVHLPFLQQKEKLTQSFDKWKGGLEQVDDVCIIGIRV
jgi:tetratricopeptide (TPR) repeat protein